MELRPEILRARLLPPSLEPRRKASLSVSSISAMSPRVASPPFSPIFLSPIPSPTLTPRTWATPVQASILSPHLSSCILSPLAGVVTEEEILATPLQDCHKQLAIMHYYRLMRIATASDPMALPAYTTKALARDQLARMTLVIRDFVAHYTHKQRKHLRPNASTQDDAAECACGESIIADVIDATFNVPGVKGNLVIPFFPSPLREARDHEVAALVQETYAGNLDDVTELWNVPSQTFPMYGENVVPDTPYAAMVHDLGAEVDWGGLCRRSASESNLLHYVSKDPVDMQDLRKSQVHLTKVMQKGRKTRASVAWPPTGRSRSVSEATEVPIDWATVRKGAAAQRLRWGREMGNWGMVEGARSVLEEMRAG